MPEVDSDRDDRIVLTLDAGGTNFVFAAMQGNRRIGTPVRLASEARNLERSLENIKKGFRALIEETGQAPAAISFAFPGPADYPRGIIDNVGNLPAYAGGVPLADILQDEFGVPVFINNDGDLFVYGEAVVHHGDVGRGVERGAQIFAAELVHANGGGRAHHGRDDRCDHGEDERVFECVERFGVTKQLVIPFQ